jgi:hypothetical protein
MGSLPEAIEALHLHLEEPEPRTRQISRHLQDAGLLPKSAGRRIEQLMAVHVATLILGVSTAKKASDAPRNALTWGRMTPNGEPLRQPVAGEPPPMLIEIISAMLAYVWSEAGAGPMSDVVLRSTLEITTTRPHAIVDFNGRREHYLPAGGEKLSGRQRVDRIPGAVMHRIAMALIEGARKPPAIPADVVAGLAAQDAQPTNFERDPLPAGQ